MMGDLRYKIVLEVNSRANINEIMSCRNFGWSIYHCFDYVLYLTERLCKEKFQSDTVHFYDVVKRLMILVRQQVFEYTQNMSEFGLYPEHGDRSRFRDEMVLRYIRYDGVLEKNEE